MINELSEITVIRLHTELENAIGFRDYYLVKQDYQQYNIWDTELSNILEQIMEMNK